MIKVKVRRLRERTSPHGGRLGRHVEHDERSRDYSIRAVKKADLHEVMWTRADGPFDQGDVGSCTGNAIAGALNTAPFFRGGTPLTETDALRLYSEATHLDRYQGTYPPEDTGSSGLAACKAAKREGRISAYHHAFSVRAALTALMDGPVITGVPWFEGFDRPDASGLVTIAGGIRGGHEFLVVGYDPATDVVTAWNSWGAGWGRGGQFSFTARTWRQLLKQQGDVTVPVVNVVAATA